MAIWPFKCIPAIRYRIALGSIINGSLAAIAMAVAALVLPCSASGPGITPCLYLYKYLLLVSAHMADNRLTLFLIEVVFLF